MKTVRGFLIFWLITFSALAQEGPTLDVDSTLVRQLLIPISGRTNFSMKIRAETFTPSGAIKSSRALRFAVADGARRCDFLFGDSTDYTAEKRLLMARYGLDEMSVIERPGETNVWLVYPKINAFCEMPLSELGAPALPELVETVVGRDEYLGDVCTLVKITQESKPGQEVTVWRLKRMAGFPIKAELKIPGGSPMELRFNEVELTKPAAELFAIPTNYVKLAKPDDVGRVALEARERRLEQLGRAAQKKTEP